MKYRHLFLKALSGYLVLLEHRIPHGLETAVVLDKLPGAGAHAVQAEIDPRLWTKDHDLSLEVVEQDVVSDPNSGR